MKKMFASLFSMFVLSILLPVLAFAEGENQNPITKIKDKMKFRWEVLENLDFVFLIVMIPVTLLLVGTFVFSLIRIATFIWKISHGKASIKNKEFWIEMGAVVLILFLFISGAFFSFLENMYNWTNKQNIGSNTSAFSTTNWVIPYEDNKANV